MIKSAGRGQLSPIHSFTRATNHNNLIGFANDSTLITLVPSQSVRIAVAESFNHDLIKVSEWCVWPSLGMKFNTRKTKTMIVSRSCTMHLQTPPLTIGGTVLKELMTLIYWEWHLKITFAKHLHLVFRASFKGLISWGSPDKYFMIDCSLEEAFGILSCPLWSSIL